MSREQAAELTLPWMVLLATAQQEIEYERRGDMVQDMYLVTRAAADTSKDNKGGKAVQGHVKKLLSAGQPKAPERTPTKQERDAALRDIEQRIQNRR